MSVEGIIKALQAIADGYAVKTDGMGEYIQVENPDYQEDRGDDPYLVIDMKEVIAMLSTNPVPVAPGLGDPVRSFDETFSAESVVMDTYFPSSPAAPDETGALRAEVKRLRRERDYYLENSKESRRYLTIETSHARQAEDRADAAEARNKALEKALRDARGHLDNLAMSCDASDEVTARINALLANNEGADE